MDSKITNSKQIGELPDEFKNLIDSSYFPKQLYNKDELVLIRWFEEQAQRVHKTNGERITGGPSYRHIQDIIKTLFILDKLLFEKQKRGGLGLADFLSKRGYTVSEELGLIKITPTILITAIAHDDFEDDLRIKSLLEKYKLLLKHQISKDEWRILDSLTVEIDKKREAIFRERWTDFQKILENDISWENRFRIEGICRISERLIKSLTRHVEQREYINSMYHFFGIAFGYSYKDILVKSIVKICDRIANINDTKRIYSEKELEKIKKLYYSNPELKEKFGDLKFESRDFNNRERIYNIAKSIIVLNSMGRKLLNTPIAGEIWERKYAELSFYLHLVLVGRQKLINDTLKQALILKERLEKQFPDFIHSGYLEKTERKIENYRKEGFYDEVTDSDETTFGHGTLKLVFKKNNFFKYLDELEDYNPKKKERFLYLTVRNFIEVLKDFNSTEKREHGKHEVYNAPERFQFHVIKGLTGKLKPKVINGNNNNRKN